MGAYYLLARSDFCRCCTRNNKTFSRKYKEEKISILWNWPIRFIFEAYMELAVATLLKLRGDSYSYESPADFFDTFLGIFYLGLIFVAPFFAVIFFSVNADKLKDSVFFEKYETVFEATKIEKRW
jgi:hypothetical protein